jgi:hypothetical protein
MAVKMSEATGHHVSPVFVSEIGSLDKEFDMHGCFASGDSLIDVDEMERGCRV